jgi:hypothetical protein
MSSIGPGCMKKSRVAQMRRADLEDRISDALTIALKASVVGACGQDAGVSDDVGPNDIADAHVRRLTEAGWLDRDAASG